MEADNVSNLILEQMRGMRNEIRDVRVQVEQGFRDVTARLASVEGHVVQLHKSVALTHEDIAGLNVRLDGLSERISRVERRLELRDPA